MHRHGNPFGHLEGVQAQRRDGLVAEGEDLEPAARFLVPEQHPVLRLGGFEDQEGNVEVGGEAQQVEDRVGLAGAGDAGDEGVTGQLGGPDAVLDGGDASSFHHRSEHERVGAHGRGHGVELGHLRDREPVGLHGRQVHVRRELRGAEQRLVLEGVLVASRCRIGRRVWVRQCPGLRERGHILPVPDPHRLGQGAFAGEQPPPQAGDLGVAFLVA
jgi:hypothetical protein